MATLWKDLEGQIVNGKFPLLRYLGASDQSAVFQTEYDESGVRVRAAIKLIPTDAENAERQLSRLQQAAKISHPRLVRLFQTDHGQLGDMRLVYVVMEYAEEALSQILPERPLTPKEAREMLEPVLEALAYVHGKGFVHGHMTPANILAIGDQLKISSDGLCPAGTLRETLGGTGKPDAYSPPETAAKGSPAGDMWSLGVTLVQALTQQLPIWKENQQGEPTLPGKIPDPFLDIVRHCLQEEPQSRWTVADCLARLRHMGTAPPKVHAAAASKSAAPGRRYAVAAIAVSLVLAVALVVSKVQKRQPEAERAPSIRSAPQTESDRREIGSAPPVVAPRPSAGSAAPVKVVAQIVPQVPQSASNTIQGTVRVRIRVKVDASGDVVGAVLETPGPSKYFANLALQAAQRWKFEAADGRDARELILRFEFTRTATRSFLEQ